MRNRNSIIYLYKKTVALSLGVVSAFSLISATATTFVRAQSSLSCTEFLCDPHNAFCGVLCQIIPQLPSFFIGGGVIAAIVFIVIYGINYMSAGDDAKKIANAKNGILWAVVGLAILILAFGIIRAVALLIGTSPTQIFVIDNVGNCTCD